jgi:hypothetical protein
MKKHLSICLVTLLALLAWNIVHAEDSKPDDEGFIKTWLVLAPIPLADDATGAEAIDKQLIPNEGQLQPKEGEKTKVGDKELKWTTLKAKDYYLDLNEALGTDNSNCCAYAIAYIVCDADAPNLTLLMGSNDEGKVYVNGKEAVKFSETRTIDKDSDKADNITLKKGVNTIVFKCINEVNNWQLCLRFKNKDGSPFKNFTVRTNP